MEKTRLIKYFDDHAAERDRWRKWNWYYHETIENLARYYIPEKSDVLEIGSGTGELLASLDPARGIGVDVSCKMVEIANQRYPQHEWLMGDAEHLHITDRFKYVVMTDLIGYVEDVQQTFKELHKVSSEQSRIIITYYNYIWEPILKIAELLGLKAPQPVQNWISSSDMENMLHLAGFEVVQKGKKMLCPVWIPLISAFTNKFLANLPLLWRLGLVQYVVARQIPQDSKEYSVSIIIPARNERGNIERAVLETPNFGTMNEIIFVEGHSKDGTLEEIKRVADAYAGKRNIRWAVQDGIGKGDAVRKGFDMAKGDVLMILDADLTMPPHELPKFYEALASGRGEFINGSRLVYPLEKDSMRILNMIGNKFFGMAFSWLLGQRIKDTLCGTKVLFKKDYEKIAKGRKYFGEFDPFGDFDLLFGASKLGLKIVDLPVRYRARAYGTTNIQRWKHGMLLLRMVWFAMWRMKFI